MRKLARRVAFAAAAALVFVTLVAGAEPGARLLLSAIEWVRGAGPAGLVVFLGLYAATTWLMVPASWMQMVAGFLFGPVTGFLVALACSTGFGAVSFRLARGALRDRIQRRLARGRWLATLDGAVTEGGAPMVALLRVSPISPYNIVNYALGLTGVRFRDYLVGTLAGSLLPLVLYAQLGASASDLAAVVAGEATGPAWVQWLGLALTALATVGVTAKVRAALRRRGLTSTETAELPSSASASLRPARR